MALVAGDRVVDPRSKAAAPRVGTVVAVERNPACLKRVLTVIWEDGGMEEIEEEAFGPVDD